MTPFTAIQADEPLRLLQVGAGGMGRTWIKTIIGAPSVKLVGLVDLDETAARSALAAENLDSVAVGRSVSEVASQTGAQAIVNVTIPEAHHPVTSEALKLGLPVLSEKPAAPTVSQALSLAAASEVAGRLVMVSQSRRYYATIAELRRQVAGLGKIGLVTTQFFKAPHFGGFREQMAHVLLVDMAIHAFDAVRYVLSREPISVYCEEFNPPWSWYDSDAAANAIFEFEDGVRYVYSGSWCADGLETSWNGSWRVNGEKGTVVWDGEGMPRVERLNEHPASPPLSPAAVPEEIAGALTEFVDALRDSRVPSGEIHANIYSLAMVEAAVRSADSGARVMIAEVLEDAYRTALEVERDPNVREVLAHWTGALPGIRR